jgi:hypothetical protein
VSCEPPGMHACRLLVLLTPWDIRGSKANGLFDGVPLPGRRHHLTNRSVVDGKTKDHGDIQQHHRDLTRWKVEPVGLRMPPVHECHQHGGGHQRQTTVDEPSKWQEPARHMNDAYHSSQCRGMCVQILSGFKRCRTQQQ